MRIAMVSEHASPLAVLGGVDAGGQNVHVAAISEALARRGHTVTVHTRRDDPILPRRVTLGPEVVVDHVSAGPPEPLPKDQLLPYMGEFAEELRWQWRANPPDVVHAHFWMSGLAAVAATAPLGIPVAVTFHALGTVKRRHQRHLDTSPPERLGIEHRLLQTADLILATCRDEVRELALMGGDLNRISVVPCGVDAGLFTPDGPAEPRSGRPRIAVVGRLVERKGIATVIRALAGVPDAELVIVGGPGAAELATDPEAVRLRAVAADLGVEDRVLFRGRVARDALPALIRSCDLVVCVPEYEPFGIVPLEAMACGVPVVASAVGGQLETVVPARTGLHVRPGDPEGLAAAIRALLADRRLRAQMGAAGVRRVRARYQWDRVAASTEKTYRVVGATSRRTADMLEVRS